MARTIGDNASNPGGDCSNSVWINQMRYGGFFNGFGSRPNDGYDADGWPNRVDTSTGPTTTQIARNARFPAGDYPFLYDGEGTVKFRGGQFNGTGTPTIVCDGTPRTLNLAAANSPGVILFDIYASNPSNRLRNIRFNLPGYEATNRAFTNEYLDQQVGHKTKRFMDWSATNGSALRNWTDAGRIGKGFGFTMRGRVSEEFQQLFLMELLARTGQQSEWWACFPHFATYSGTGNWIDGFANLVKNGATIDGFTVPPLPAGWTILAETSNETWNGQFPQQSQMNALRASMITQVNAWQAANPGKFLGGFEFISHIKAALAAKSQVAFAGSGINLKNTVMQQGLVPAFSQVEINNFALPNLFIGESDRPDGVPNIPSNIPIHVLGGGIYVHPGTSTGASLNMTTLKNIWTTDHAAGRDAYFAALPPYLAFLTPPLAAIKAKADGIGARFAIYEAGLDANSFIDNTLQPFLQDCFSDARNYDIAIAMIQAIPDGADPVAWYKDCEADGGFGWGARKFTGQPLSSAHVERALQDTIAGNPPPDPTPVGPRRWPRGLMRLRTTTP